MIKIIQYFFNNIKMESSSSLAGITLIWIESPVFRLSIICKTRALEREEAAYVQTNLSSAAVFAEFDDHANFQLCLVGITRFIRRPRGISRRLGVVIRNLKQ